MALLETGASVVSLGLFFAFLLRVLHGPTDTWAERDLEWMSAGWCVQNLPDVGVAVWARRGR